MPGVVKTHRCKDRGYSLKWYELSEGQDQYFLMLGMDDLYGSKRSYDGAVPGAVSPIDWIGPL